MVLAASYPRPDSQRRASLCRVGAAGRGIQTLTVHQPAVVTVSPPQDSHEIGYAGRRANRLGWLSVALLTLVVAATWAPMLNAAFGDSHDGRIMARYALHMRNLHEQGPVDSQFSADWRRMH
jgi:hypothetical protein